MIGYRRDVLRELSASGAVLATAGAEAAAPGVVDLRSLKKDTELYNLKAVPFLIQSGIITDHYRYLFAKTEFLTWMKNESNRKATSHIAVISMVG